MSEKIHVSIVVPAHNEEKYVERCIAKVRNAGINIAKGKIIITIDCDNRMAPGTIARYTIYYAEKQ